MNKILDKHLFGCGYGWLSERDKADLAVVKQWCSCGILDARAEYAALQAENARLRELLTRSLIAIIERKGNFFDDLKTAIRAELETDQQWLERKVRE